MAQKGFVFNFDDTQKYYVGCVVVDTTDGQKYECIVDAPAGTGEPHETPANWVKFGGSNNNIPVGAIFQYAGNGENPQGALLCDGSAVSRTMYADLFEKIGTTYGAGDGSTTFNLPNLSDNRFVEGSTTAGATKSAGLPNITGKSPVKGETSKSTDGTGAFRKDIAVSNSDYSGNSSSTFDRTVALFDASLSNPIYGNSDTVQPKSLTLRFFIQAFDGQTPDSALIDITHYAEELATKANRQLSNLDTANLACHVVVDSYYDSSTGDWWRVYDDGWIEQGGTAIIPASPNTGTMTINLLKPFADTTYAVVSTATLTSVAETTATFAWYGGVVSKTTTTFTCGYNHTYSTNRNWVAYGRGASV